MTLQVDTSNDTEFWAMVALLLLDCVTTALSLSLAFLEPNTVSYSQSSLIHLVGPSDCTLHGFVHGGRDKDALAVASSLACPECPPSPRRLFPCHLPLPALSIPQEAMLLTDLV